MHRYEQRKFQLIKFANRCEFIVIGVKLEIGHNRSMMKPRQDEAKTLREYLKQDTYKLENVGVFELAPDHNFFAKLLMQLLHIRSLCLSEKPNTHRDTLINDMIDILQDASQR